jgi:prephenate dehydrogenase
LMRIAILGAGSMGSWLARGLSGDNDVAVHDTDNGKAAGCGCRALSGAEELHDFAPQMLINVVSLQNTVAAFESALAHIPNGCVLCDMASVKSGIPEFYAKAGRRFVSVHPMFGPTFASMDSLGGENAVIIRESDAEGAAFMRKFFSALNLNIFEYSFDEHDRMMAYSLTTPFASSMVFAACMEKGAVPGTTFARHREIAEKLLSEDDHLLAEILFNPYSIAQIEKITSRLEFLKHIVRGRDYEEAGKFFAKLRGNLE